MGELDGTVVVVTGANRGLGAAIAVAMAREGARLVAAARDVSSAEGVMRRLQETGADCMAVAADVLSEDSMAALAAAVFDRFGRADVVVANAGITGPTRPMHEITLEEWRLCLAADLDGVFLTFRPFVPQMIEQGGGSLIAISSMTGKRPLAGRTPYAAAKMGVIGLCRSLALELGPHGVCVNSVCPGAVSGPRIVGVIREQGQAAGRGRGGRTAAVH